MKIFYDENSIDCIAATYLLAKYFEELPNIEYDSITALGLQDVVMNIDATEIIILVGWHRLSPEQLDTIISACAHFYWFAADPDSNAFIDVHREDFNRHTNKPHILVDIGDNVSTSTIVYMNFFTNLDMAKSSRWKRKIVDQIPQWLLYLNMKDSIRAERFQYAIKKEMNGPSDEKWHLFDKEGTSAIAEVIKWIDRGQALMERDQKEAEQQALLQQQGKQRTYKAPDSWVQ